MTVIRQNIRRLIKYFQLHHHFPTTILTNDYEEDKVAQDHLSTTSNYKKLRA